MLDNIHNPELYKKNILPKLENKIRSEINSIVDSLMKERGLIGNDARENLFNELHRKLYQELESHSSDNFFEREYVNTIKTFSKNLPYRSMDHFIETHLQDLFKSDKMIKEIEQHKKDDSESTGQDK